MGQIQQSPRWLAVRKRMLNDHFGIILVIKLAIIIVLPFTRRGGVALTKGFREGAGLRDLLPDILLIVYFRPRVALSVPAGRAAEKGATGR